MNSTEPDPSVLPEQSKILLYLGYPPDTGYAISRLSRAFASAASHAVGGSGRIVLGWGAPGAELTQVGAGEVLIDSQLLSSRQEQEFTAFVARERIWAMLGLDLAVRSKHVVLARRAGVKSVVSYWGAPMSGERPAFIRMIKRIQTALSHGRPDHFVFESEAMRRTAVVGLGVPAVDTSVVPIGVDVERFRNNHASGYCAQTFGFPSSRRVVTYSGHFEERKGVAVLARAAIELMDRRGRSDLQFVLAGNRTIDESAPYRAILEGTRARDHVTFAGYRDDLPRIFADSFVGCIASTGWDSFTVSAIEMQASGLPVIVSALQGLPETIRVGQTGLTFPPGDHVSLADSIVKMLDSPARRDAMAIAAANYAAAHLRSDQYEARLAEVLRQQLLRNRSRWMRVNSWGAVW